MQPRLGRVTNVFVTASLKLAAARMQASGSIRCCPACGDNLPLVLGSRPRIACSGGRLQAAGIYCLPCSAARLKRRHASETSRRRSR